MHSYVQSCSFQLPMWMVLEAGSIDDAELSSEFGHFSVQLPLSDLNLKPRAAVRARPIPSERAFRCNTQQNRAPRVSPQVGQQTPRVPKFPSHDS